MFIRVKVKVLVLDARVAVRTVSGEPEVAHVVGSFTPAFLKRDQALVLFSVVAAGIEENVLFTAGFFSQSGGPTRLVVDLPKPLVS